MKSKFINGGLLVVSILLVLFLAETASRLIVHDFDKWGFRNDVVPDSAAIVTIGDCQTFGINASFETSWPARLQDMSNQSVYNLSLSGYGPAQYFHLFKTKALSLNPDQIIVGYYIGNDPLEAFEMVYNYKAWKELRDPEFLSWLAGAKSDTLTYLTANIFEPPADAFLNELDAWLVQNSILYRLAFYEPEVSEEDHSKNKMYAHLSLPEKNINEIFRPLRPAFQTEISNKKVQEGLRLTLQFFKKMSERSKQKGIKFTVLFIPTKEMVFCHYLFNNRELRHSKAINNLLNNERIIREISIKYFMEHRINFVDALPLMQRNIGREKLYAPDFSSRPNNTGYYLIAKSVFNKIQEDRFFETSMAGRE